MTDDTLNRREFAQLVAVAGATAALAGNVSYGSATATKLSDESVMELVDVLGMSNSLVELKDGSLLSNDGRRSHDGGLTWSAPAPFEGGAAGTSLFRLKSGKLALVAGVGYSSGRMWASTDEGANWTLSGQIQVPGGPIYELGDTMIQLESGRLLYCWDYNMAGAHPELKYEDVTATGTWKGQKYAVEGHGHLPEFFASGFSWSDDEGRTWTVGMDRDMPNVLMGWFDTKGEPNGRNGISQCGEASIAELRDGRVMIFGRSTVGRIVQSFSANRGEHWSALRPSALAASNSPPRLRRIPKTGDLLCVWNQVSVEEIRRGFRRGRLSAAISQDDGATWGHFRTIEQSEGLAEVSAVELEPEIQDVRARQDVGQLPDGYMYAHYANVCFAADKVYVMYSRGNPEMGVAEQLLHRQHPVMRIFPLDWYYS